MSNYNWTDLDAADDVSFEEAQMAELDAGEVYDEDAAYAEWYADAAMAQYDDDPNPYHGDYSDGGDYGWYDG